MVSIVSEAEARPYLDQLQAEALRANIHLAPEHTTAYEPWALVFTLGSASTPVSEQPVWSVAGCAGIRIVGARRVHLGKAFVLPVWRGCGFAWGDNGFVQARLDWARGNGFSLATSWFMTPRQEVAALARGWQIEVHGRQWNGTFDLEKSV